MAWLRESDGWDLRRFLEETTLAPAEDSWHQTVERVVDRNLLTECSGCILARPRDVLESDLTSWQPLFSKQAWIGDDPATCVYQQRGCTMCTRACARFGA